MALFSNYVAFREKNLMSLLSCLTKLNIFEKRAANLIRMHKIAITTLKSAFGF